MALQRLLSNVTSEDLAGSTQFYTRLFGFTVAFESDWFVQLTAQEGALELGIMQRQHELVPSAYRQAPTGFYITFVVEDADAVHAQAQAEGYTVVAPPEDTFYGQRRLLLQAPEGTLVDVSSLIPNFQFGG